MTLGKEIKRIVGLAGFAALMAGCRFVSVESINSSSAPNEKQPSVGDPYAWGGIQEGTGGLVAADKQTMETPIYADPPKFIQLAGVEGFASMSGWVLHPAKANEVSGDHQPLPHQEAAGGHEEEGH
jgi:hypothetical protein